MKPDKKQGNNKQQYRINEQIRVREVRIVGEDGSTVVPTRQALDMAHDQGVDLVEISPNANPPVCRLIDYSKFLYQQKKRQKEMKAKQVKVEVKEIRLDPRPTSTTTSSSSSTPRSSSKMVIRFARMCSSVAVPFFSRSRARCSCCVLPTTWRNTER